jgi:glutathione-independent formaldehyde dehydrogenase
MPSDGLPRRPVEAITAATDGFGVDCGVEAVGYQAHDPAGQEHPSLVLDNLVNGVRATGSIGVLGVYGPEDPGASPKHAKKGRYASRFGTTFAEGLTIGTGQCLGSEIQRSPAGPDHPGAGTSFR